jgi:hypothetical protein
MLHPQRKGERNAPQESVAWQKKNARPIQKAKRVVRWCVEEGVGCAQPKGKEEGG